MCLITIVLGINEEACRVYENSLFNFVMIRYKMADLRIIMCVK